MNRIIGNLICLWHIAIFLPLGSTNEAIIKDDTIREWYKSAYNINGFGELWSSPIGSDTFSETCGNGKDGDIWLISEHVNLSEIFPDLIYVDVETSEFKLCFDPGSSKYVPCYSNYFQVYVYLGQNEPNIPSGNDRPAVKKYLLNNFSPMYNITTTTSPVKATNKTENHTFTFHQNQSKGITFGIRSRGACWRIYRMKMYYYYCEETCKNRVMFVKTISPAGGSKEVHGNCSINSSLSNKERNLNGSCSSNGTWFIPDTINCSCIQGFYSGHDECDRCTAPCPSDHYKPTASSFQCIRCPSNSVNTTTKTTCQCKSGYYRPIINTALLSPCYGLVKMDKKPKVEDTSDGSVNITWNKPNSNGGLNETIMYDVECYFCEENLCNKLCIGKIYSPSQYNLTGTSVVISDLYNGLYIVRVYPKNSLNELVRKEKWNFTTTKQFAIHLAGKISKQPYPSSSCYTTTIVVPVAIVTFVMGFVFGTMVERRKKTKKCPAVELEEMPTSQTNEASNYADVDEMSGPSRTTDISSILSSFQDVKRSDTVFWEFPRRRLVMVKKLGEGSFGTVNKAQVIPIHAMTSGVNATVAVKMLKENASFKDQRDFSSELDLMKKLEPHPHVAQLLGCCTLSEPYFLILEYLVGGDLLGYLRKSRGHKDPYNTGEYVPTSRLGEKNLLSFAWMISDGMVYLASKGIVHRDLAARNVLVGEHNICKVSDFGLAREGTYERVSKARLPVKWMAPEDLFHGYCTTMSDVWSYGILLWEIFTIGGSPYPGLKGADVFRSVESGYRMPKQSHFSDKLYSMMFDCWNDEPKQRPQFSKISVFFQEMLNDVGSKIYLDLTKYAEHDYVNFDVI